MRLGSLLHSLRLQRRPGGQQFPWERPARRDPWSRRTLTWALALLVVIGAIIFVAVRPSASPSGGGGGPAAPAPAAQDQGGLAALGPLVYVFGPTTPQAQIQSTVDTIARDQATNQFGPQRYALLFQPGTYGSAAHPLSFQVGYYTQVAGLGQNPSDVTINGVVDVRNQCRAQGTSGPQRCSALENFWRSLSNLTVHVTGQTGCEAGTDIWAVSQAAPIRQVELTGGRLALTDACTTGPHYASGGFIADSRLADPVTDGAQQQFLVRNTDLSGWSNGLWNQVFAGDPGAPVQSFSVSSGRANGTEPYTTLATNPVTEAEPYLAQTATGYAVLVPPVRTNSSGPSWASGPAPTAIDLQRFFVATPTSGAATINAALAAGQDLIFTPGVYHLNQTIEVTHPHTVVLGLGFPTLIPASGVISMNVANVAGVKLSGLIFDAGPVRSPVLLQVGAPGTKTSGDASDPTLIQDTYFRIGGAEAGQATDSLVVNSPNVILDDIWAWRADHGAGVGWTSNTADTGVAVNGGQVTAYGLFVEHYQKAEVVWRGQDGTDVFFQNEMPYDPPSQAAWTQGAGFEGYPALQIGPGVTSFRGYGLGSYCDFNQGQDIQVTAAFQTPDAPGVQLHDLLTYFLNGSGEIAHVVDN
jgi:hypothetical protein